MQDQPQTRNDLLLPDHHRRLEILFQELQDESKGDDPRALCACWSRFERELEDHLCAEEEHILPAFAHAHPDEAGAIERDHVEIRKLVGDLGVGVDLHVLRAATAAQLIEKLRLHAHREDRLMYPWAAEHLPKIVDLRSTLGALATLVDEVRLKIHLAGMDAQETFAAIELEAARARSRVGAASVQTAKLLIARLRSIAESISASDGD